MGLFLTCKKALWLLFISAGGLGKGKVVQSKGDLDWTPERPFVKALREVLEAPYMDIDSATEEDAEQPPVRVWGCRRCTPASDGALQSSFYDSMKSNFWRLG